MATETSSEFAVHVYRKHGDDEHADLYTIGVWEESTLRGICHAQPLDDAVAALRMLLQETDESVKATHV